MNDKMTFVRACHLGKAAPCDLLDWIDRWHQTPGSKHIHDFLGLTWDEYASWVEQKRTIEEIVESKR